MYKLSLVKNVAAFTGLHRIALFAGLLLATFAVQATSPTEFDINGNTITFNVPNWYQVQDSTGENTLCEGRAPCTVPDGEYIVINHSINERFTVTVGDAALGGDETQEVLLLADDGWYQVQNADTFESLCEGVSSCTVGAGRYFVINHTNGVRTETIVPAATVVTGVDPYPPYDDFVIDGKSIAFTSPGWFQVLRMQNYEAVCEGTERCDLARGGYHQVLNLTTGERWIDVYIGEDLTAAACVREGGQVVGDIGDGAIYQPEFRCESGLPPLFSVVTLKGEPFSIEGSVCCI